MLPKTDSGIENKFPHISRLGYEITSPKTISYNCIAWAGGDSTKWWWPDPAFQAYWPAAAPRICTVEAFVIAYKELGYEQCDTHEYEEGYQKIAIFTDLNGIPTHAARELVDKKTWTSKLGPQYDISHHVYGLNDSEYGSPTVFMKRKNT
jgi:hypothetical protein